MQNENIRERNLREEYPATDPNILDLYEASCHDAVAGQYVACAEKLKVVCEHDIAEARYALGMMNYLAQGTERNFPEALRLFKLCLSSGHTASNVNVGEIYLNGWGVEQDIFEAMKYFVEGARYNDARCCYLLGCILIDPIHRFNNYELAVQAFTQGAQLEHPESSHRLGLLYCEGKGVEQNIELANSLFEFAAECGVPYAQHSLGLAFEHGRGVEKDRLKAIFWYEKSARQDVAESQHNLAALMMNTGKYDQYAEQAIFWFEKAASKGMGLSMLSLHNIYKHGQGVAINEEKSKYWLMQAQNCPDSYARPDVEMTILKEYSKENNLPV